MLRFAPLVCLTLALQAAPPSANPQIAKIVSEISADRITSTLRKLESFETRFIHSETDHPTRGIGAAKRWIESELRSYSPRLQVRLQPFSLKKGVPERVIADVQLDNVVAVLPGMLHPERQIVVCAHYDSINSNRPPRADAPRVADLLKKGMDKAEAERYVKLFPGDEVRELLDPEDMAKQKMAPGVTDNGSGVAVVMELARVMSAYQFDKTIVFVAFSAEEIGLEGSKAYAKQAKKDKALIEAVLNNDIVGSDVSGSGQKAEGLLRVFGAGPEDSPSRALLRYTKEVGSRYVPSVKVDMIYRADRFLRGGDHTPFHAEGYGAVRLTTSTENYAHQHTETDTFANTSVPLTTNVAKMNAAVVASLALAPAPPEVMWTTQSGKSKGSQTPLLTRGRSQYDAVLRWIPNTEPDLEGYLVLTRRTTSLDWEKSISVGKVSQYTLPGVSIDDTVIGVRAMDTQGNLSLVAAYQPPNRTPGSDVTVKPKVVVISLDGFPGSALDDPKLPIPTLRKLMLSGAGGSMTGINPTVTWPNHTTMVTGVRADEHGLLANGTIVPVNGGPAMKVEPMIDKEKMVHVPTVYDAAHKAGLTTAQVDWVAIEKAPTITWAFREWADADGPLEKEMIAKGALTAADLENFSKANILWRDQIWTRAGVYLIKEHQPDLLLLHLLSLDSEQHQYGPGTLASRTAMAFLDSRVEELVTAVAAAGLTEKTTFLVVSDHGFKAYSKQIRPAVALQAAGLSDKVFVLPEGGSAFVYCKEPALLPRVREVLSGVEGIDAVIGVDGYSTLGLPSPDRDPQFGQLLLSARDGYSFSGATGGPITAAVPQVGGSHGYLASNPDMNPIFIASGNGVKKGIGLGPVANIDIAPTIAQLLGIKLETAKGKAIKLQ